MRLETIHPKDIAPSEVALWRGYQRANPSLQSPYLTPEWAQTIGAVRDDARVVLIEDGRGFMGVQRTSRFAAMGLGAPIADYQGIVGEPGLDVGGRELCRALKVGRVDMSHVPTGQTMFTAAGAEGSWIADVAGGKDLYLAALKDRRAEFQRQTDKKQRKFEREKGRLEFRAVSDDVTHLQTLIDWKNSQLERSGQPAIWSVPWVRKVLNATFATKAHTFSGALFTLTIDDKLVAAAYFLRSERVLHAWMVAHDPAFDSYSPGVLLMRWATMWAAENQFAEVDFGPGDYQFKRQLSTAQRSLEFGTATAHSLSGVLRKAQFAVRAGIERTPNAKIAALPGKAMRKLDLIRALAA